MKDYVIRHDGPRGSFWFLGGPNDTPPRRSGAFAWGSEVDAKRYPTKAACKRALAGWKKGRGSTVEFVSVYSGVSYYPS